VDRTFFLRWMTEWLVILLGHLDRTRNSVADASWAIWSLKQVANSLSGIVSRPPDLLHTLSYILYDPCNACKESHLKPFNCVTVCLCSPIEQFLALFKPHIILGCVGDMLGFSGELLWTRQWTFVFHKWRGISWLDEWMSASKKVISSLTRRRFCVINSVCSIKWNKNRIYKYYILLAHPFRRRVNWTLTTV
jgi:hypothetical protein